jgi:hypothetical protein
VTIIGVSSLERLGHNVKRCGARKAKKLMEGKPGGRRKWEDQINMDG